MKKLIENTLFLMMATLLVKIVSLSTQLILGYLLEIQEFGYYASALGAVGLFQWLKNGAILQYAIKESVSGKLNFNCNNYATYFNVVSCILILIVCIFYRTESNYIWLILLMFSLSQLVSLAGFRNRLELVKIGNYRSLSFYEVGFGIIFSLSTLIGAAVFKDERCFFAGIMFSTIFELYVYYRYQEDKKLFHFGLDSLKNTWDKGRWLLLGALGSVLVMKGGFMILEHVSDHYTLGLYYFSFQLASSISILMGESIRKVVMPFLAKKNDNVNQLTFYSYLLVSFSIVLIPLSLSMYPLMEPLITGLWEDKWIETVYPAELFMATMFYSILISLSYSQLEASGHWKVKNISQVLDGLLLVMAAGVGAILGGIDLIVYLVVIRRVLYGTIQISIPFIIMRKFNFRIYFYLSIIFLVSVISLIAIKWILALLVSSKLIVDLIGLVIVSLISVFVFLSYNKERKLL